MAKWQPPQRNRVFARGRNDQGERTYSTSGPGGTQR